MSWHERNRPLRCSFVRRSLSYASQPASQPGHKGEGERHAALIPLFKAHARPTPSPAQLTVRLTYGQRGHADVAAQQGVCDAAEFRARPRRPNAPASPLETAKPVRRGSSARLRVCACARRAADGNPAAKWTSGPGRVETAGKACFVAGTPPAAFAGTLRGCDAGNCGARKNWTD